MVSEKKKENECEIQLNPKIYPLDVVYSAAYVFLDKAFISFDGDPEKEVTVNIRPRKDQDPEKIADQFKNELINYLEYRVNFQRNKEVRDMIVQKALLANDPGLNNCQAENFVDDSDSFPFDENEDQDFLDDELGIAVPWEEKYGENEDEDPLEIAKELDEDN